MFNPFFRMCCSSANLLRLQASGNNRPATRGDKFNKTFSEDDFGGELNTTLEESAKVPDYIPLKESVANFEDELKECFSYHELDEDSNTDEEWSIIDSSGDSVDLTDFPEKESNFLFPSIDLPTDDEDSNSSIHSARIDSDFVLPEREISDNDEISDSYEISGDFIDSPTSGLRILFPSINNSEEITLLNPDIKSLPVDSDFVVKTTGIFNDKVLSPRNDSQSFGLDLMFTSPRNVPQDDVSISSIDSSNSDFDYLAFKTNFYIEDDSDDYSDCSLHLDTLFSNNCATFLTSPKVRNISNEVGATTLKRKRKVHSPSDALKVSQRKLKDVRNEGDILPTVHTFAKDASSFSAETEEEMCIREFEEMALRCSWYQEDDCTPSPATEEDNDTLGLDRLYDFFPGTFKMNRKLDRYGSRRRKTARLNGRHWSDRFSYY